MGETRQTGRLSDASGRRAIGRVAEGSALTRLLKRFAADQGGATAIEYAVLIVFLGAGVITALGVFQESLYGMINTAVEAVNGVGS